MANYILLCHGSQIEYSSFDVPTGSEIVYWGAPGYLLPADVAWTAINQIRMNPTDLESINRYFEGLPPLSDRTLVGGKSYAPDLALSGSDNPPCVIINLADNTYAPLGNGWTGRLKYLSAALNNDLVHLLCCTGEEAKPDLRVLEGLAQKDPDKVFP